MVTPETIRRVRVEAGITQSELARRAGLRQASISRFETGREQPRPETFERILAAARAHPHVLLQRNRDAVLDAVRRHRASNPRVSGSVATQQDAPASGVELLVTFAPDASLIDATGLMRDLERILGAPVDVLSDRAEGRTLDRDGRGNRVVTGPGDDRMTGLLDDIRRLLSDAARIVERGRDRFFAAADRTERLAAKAIVLDLQARLGALPDQVRDRYPEVAWDELRAMRDFLVRSDTSSDSTILWNALTTDFPLLRGQLGL